MLSVVHRIKCVKVRALFAKNEVRCARAEQLWTKLTTTTTTISRLNTKLPGMKSTSYC